MKLQTELCIAAGIPIRELEPMEVYLAGGAIIHSQTLRKYLMKYIVGAELPKGTRKRVLLSGEVAPDDMARIRQEAYAAIQPKLKGK